MSSSPEIERPVDIVTGCAGFIGFHVTKRLLDDGRSVVGVDNVNDYYDVSLKEARLNQLNAYEKFSFNRVDLGDSEKLSACFKPDVGRVVHLAAQAGVRYSLTNPHVYAESN